MALLFLSLPLSLHVILKLDIFYHCAEGLDVIDQNASYLIFSLMILITFRFAE